MHIHRVGRRRAAHAPTGWVDVYRREPVRVVHHQAAREASPRGAGGAAGRHAAPPAPPVTPWRDTPILSAGEARGHRRKAPLLFSGQNHFRLHENAGLGHWTSFSRKELLRDKRPDLYERAYGR
jgi:hypothetical protein